jgi:hypothetical protein
MRSLVKIPSLTIRLGMSGEIPLPFHPPNRLRTPLRHRQLKLLEQPVPHELRRAFMSRPDMRAIEAPDSALVQPVAEAGADVHGSNPGWLAISACRKSHPAWGIKGRVFF